MIPLPQGRKPTPRTLSAVLFCETEKKPRPHSFSRIIEIEDDDTGHRKCTKFLYSCVCGNERVWGSED